MFGFSNLHIKPAAGSLNKFSYNPIHITSTDFGQLNCVYSRMMYPRESLSIDMSTFMRTEVPLLKPSFGKVSIKSAAIAVPCKRLFMSSDGFFGNKLLSDGAESNGRNFSWLDLTQRFCFDSDLTTAVSSTAAYDFTYKHSNGNQYYLKFTKVGRYVYKVLRSLGYALPSGISFIQGSLFMANQATIKLNALPWLAFLTAYSDCFSPRAKQDVSNLAKYLYGVRAGNNVVTLQCTDLISLTKAVAVYYGNSYLTSAWESPVSPITTSKPYDGDSLNLYHSSDYYNLPDDSNTKPHGSTEPISESRLTSRTVDYLNRLQKFFKRNMLSGSRAYEALKSQFGINTSSAQHDFSHILDVQSTPLNIGDVTATAQTGSGSDITYVGDYAAKAIVSGNSGFKFTAKEHTMFLIFSWISIEPFNWTGMKRDVFRIKPLDFYQPEFDGLDSQPVLQAEVATTPYKINSDAILQDVSIFGFTNRYDDLRFDNDMITGDFSLNSVQKDIRECWHFGRRDMDKLSSENFHAQSDAVLKVNGPSYDNIFADYNTDGDHFNAQYLFRITLMSPMQSFNEVAQLGVGDLTIERNGNQLS